MSSVFETMNKIFKALFNNTNKNDYKILGPFDPDTKTIKTNIRAKHNLTEDETKQLALKDAVKFDQKKPRMSLIPSLSLFEIAKVMTHGAQKYYAHNWMKGFDWTRLYDAGQRHLTAWNMGEDIDPESGYPHLAHALCCFMMLYDTTQLYPEKDDRWHGWKKRSLETKKETEIQTKK